MTESEFHAWAAGLFDGEGNVSLYFYACRVEGRTIGSAYRFRLRVGMCDIEPLERLHELFGGWLHEVGSTRKGRRHFVWQVGGENAVNTARALLPFSIAKHERLRLFIKAWERKREIPLVSGNGRGGHKLHPHVAKLLAVYSKKIIALNHKGPAARP